MHAPALLEGEGLCEPIDKQGSNIEHRDDQTRENDIEGAVVGKVYGYTQTREG